MVSWAEFLGLILFLSYYLCGNQVLGYINSEPTFFYDIFCFLQHFKAILLFYIHYICTFLSILIYWVILIVSFFSFGLFESKIVVIYLKQKKNYIYY